MYIKSSKKKNDNKTNSGFRIILILVPTLVITHPFLFEGLIFVNFPMTTVYHTKKIFVQPLLGILLKMMKLYMLSCQHLTVS